MGTQTFDYTGSEVDYVVPDGVTEITVEAWGAEGSSINAPGGLGGYIKTVVAVTPFETLKVRVGGAPPYAGAGGFNGGQAGSLTNGIGGVTYGGDGGGMSDVRRAADALADQIVVAGGGGGAGASRYHDPDLYFQFSPGTPGAAVDGTQGWSCDPTSWYYDGSGSAVLEGHSHSLGSFNALGHSLVVRTDGQTAAPRHRIVCDLSYYGSRGSNGEGAVWGYNGPNDYWFAIPNSDSGAGEIGYVSDGVKTVVTALNCDSWVNITVDHNFSTGVLTVDTFEPFLGATTHYSGTHPWSVSNGKVGFLGKTQNGGSFWTAALMVGFQIFVPGLGTPNLGAGGAGGNLVGGAGQDGDAPATGGGGGTQSAGGAAGDSTFSGNYEPDGVGGRNGHQSDRNGLRGSGGYGYQANGGGGGGGGYYGGGAGGGGNTAGGADPNGAGGGGGGSSYSSGTILELDQGVRSGNGQIVFHYSQHLHFTDSRGLRDNKSLSRILGQTVQLNQSAANAIFNPRPTGG